MIDVRLKATVDCVPTSTMENWPALVGNTSPESNIQRVKRVSGKVLTVVKTVDNSNHRFGGLCKQDVLLCGINCLWEMYQL